MEKQRIQRIYAGINGGFKHLRELEEKELKNNQNQYLYDIQKLKEEIKKMSDTAKYHKIAINHFSEFNNINNIPRLIEGIIDDGQRNYRLRNESSCPKFANPLLIKAWKFGYKSAINKLSLKEALDQFINQLV